MFGLDLWCVWAEVVRFSQFRATSTQRERRAVIFRFSCGWAGGSTLFNLKSLCVMKKIHQWLSERVGAKWAVFIECVSVGLICAVASLFGVNWDAVLKFLGIG